MKDYKFIDAIGDIDEDLIAQAMEYKPKKTVKLRFIALAACLAVLMAAIPLTLVLNRKEPIFLYSSSDGVASTAHDGFDNAGKYGINSPHTELILDEMVGKKVDFGEYKGLVYKKSETKAVSEISKKKDSFYAEFDIFESEDGLVTVTYLHGTDKVIRCDWKMPKNNDNTAAIGVDNARKIAEDYILSQIDQELFDKYTFMDASVLITGHSYCVYYQRMVEGYHTEEAITVYMSTSGEIWCVWFENVEKFDNVSTKITAKKLDQAQELLIEKVESLELDEMKIIGSPRIVTDTNGTVYLCIYVEYKVDSFRVLDSFYISVN